jgi:uncharacterized membrane protein HdeD (DUF308 family)
MFEDVPPVASGNNRPAKPVEYQELWWIRLGLGLVAVVVGVLVVAWPSATVRVVAVLFGINLLVDGVMRVLQAVMTDDGGAGGRVLYGFLGVVSIALGVLCLRNILQTVEVLVLIAGLAWLVAGVIELVAGLSSGPPRRWNADTVLALGSGAVAVVAGTVLLLYPKVSLAALVVLLGGSLVLYGAVSVVGALRWRSRRQA